MSREQVEKILNEHIEFKNDSVLVLTEGNNQIKFTISDNVNVAQLLFWLKVIEMHAEKKLSDPFNKPGVFYGPKCN